MSNYEAKGKTYRYRDMSIPDDLNHCYIPTCEDQGKDLVDLLARWEKVAEVDTSPADAVLFTCVDHAGAEFEQAKRSFGRTQKTRTAAYLTKQDIERWPYKKGNRG